MRMMFVPAACLNNGPSIDAAMRVSHDGLLGQLGHREHSAVSWSHIHGRDDCVRFMTTAYSDAAIGQVALAEQYLAFIAEHGDESVLVVASCWVADA